MIRKPNPLFPTNEKALKTIGGLNMRIGLGSKVRDKITGIEGIVTGRTEYLTGCVHVAIQPQKLSSEGKILDPEWMDETRVDVIGKGVSLNPVSIPGSRSPGAKPPKWG